MAVAAPRYRLWNARRCAVVLAIALSCFATGTVALGSLIRLHPIGPAELVAADSPDGGPGWIVAPGPGPDWSTIAGAPLAAQWDRDGDGRPDERWALRADEPKRWRLPADASIDPDATLQLRYPTVSLWTLIVREMRR